VTAAAPVRGLARAVAAVAVCAAIVAACGGDGARSGAGASTGGAAATATRASTTGRTGAGAGSGARAISVIRHRRLDARLEEWTLRTPALAGPTRVRVLLPAGYARDPARRYPVLYLLHGADSDETSWTRFGAAEATTAGAPLIVVMPDGGRQGWYTNWYRGSRPVRPLWETYHVGELVPWVDAHFRTVASRRGRAIAGLSMGGYGALTYAARHPDVYAAAASFSGALEIGSEAALGPRAENAARWRAHLPIALASRLRPLALVELRTGDGRAGPLDRPGTARDCGACDLERFLHPENVRMHERLARLGIRHVWDDYGPGTHDWPYWRRDLRRTLPGLMRVLGT
jgi:diacylglycerol O-acyltransferase / trehalose O-mycolyltransferase